MFGKLTALAGLVLRTDFRPLLASVAIGYGISQLQGYAKDRQRKLAELDERIMLAEQLLADRLERLAKTEPATDAAAPYPSPVDLNPLRSDDVDQAVEFDLAHAGG